MTVTLLVRRFLLDHARNPVNILVLVLVPTVFVLVASGALADAARLLGGAGNATQMETVTAGWAAGFVAAIGMYFQIAGNRAPDRRLVQSGLTRSTFVAARLLTGLSLALIATAVACLALVARVGVIDLWPVAMGTLIFAFIYVAIGAIVGASVANAVNGTVLILFIWILDVFFGPTLSASTSAITRLLPTHFVSAWMAGLRIDHGGATGDLGWSLAWASVALACSALIVAHTTRIATGNPHKSRNSPKFQFLTVLHQGITSWRRNTVLWVLLVVVPAVFVLLAAAITPPGRMTILLKEGSSAATIVDPAHIHAGTMAPAGVAALAALAGIFVVLDNRRADRRLVTSGISVRALVAARLFTVALAATLATASSLVFTIFVFDAHNWPVYAVATWLIALTYGCIGVLLGPIFGPVSGVLIAFLVPFLDLGIGQSPMLRPEPDSWAQWLPGYGGMRMLIDGALTKGFDEGPSLLFALAWLLTAVAASTWAITASVRGQRHN